VPVSVAFTDALGALVKRHGLAMHIDGARICNAAAALGVTPARLAAAADSVSVCLSKGLGAPVGTVLVGPADFIRKVRCRYSVLRAHAAASTFHAQHASTVQH
jgi:threonine aldolase